MPVAPSPHLLVVPVLLPLAAAFVAVLLHGAPARWRRVLGVGTAVSLVAVAVLLFAAADGGALTVYRLGDWPVPVAIVLVLDRLSALMVLLTAVVGLFCVLHAVHGEDEEGSHFHALVQLQLAGLNGAFLAGDMFNLFVFFEILLIASYCLLVYGGTTPRLRSGIHYVALNLLGSALFLIAVGTIYGITGTLNMAHIAERVAQLGAADAVLLRAAALLLLVVFALKAAVAPMYFWLPGAYASAAVPVAALFALMTKVGVYAIIRVGALTMGPGAGHAAGAAEPWLLPGALLTMLVGALAALAAGEVRRMQGYLLIVSVGVMLASAAAFTVGGVSAALFYLVHSTLATAAMFLIAGLVSASRSGGGALTEGGAPLHRYARLGTLFFVGAVGLAGIPPLSGFIGKALVLSATPQGPMGGWTWALILGSSALGIIALCRAGVVLFWSGAPDVRGVPPASVSGAPPGPLLPATGLLVALLVLTVLAGPFSAFTTRAAEQVVRPEAYMRAVLETGGGR